MNLRKNEGFLTSIPCIPIPEYGQSNAALDLKTGIEAALVIQYQTNWPFSYWRRIIPLGRICAEIKVKVKSATSLEGPSCRRLSPVSVV